tara:strand:- start:11611 stop:11973 length:363 start_codon:yes stop_codon:yes gene_type:complete
MDFTILQMKFGEDTSWVLKYKCAWCSNALSNQTEEAYKKRGNCCERCSAEITAKAWDREHNKQGLFDIRQLSKQIKDKQLLLELIAEGLNFEITENERQVIEAKMKIVHQEIKDLRKMLC